MTTKQKGKTLADFKGIHDRNTVIPAKIRAAFAQMLTEDKENWDYEMDFVKRAGISMADLSVFRELFQAHVVEARAPGRSVGTTRRIWFASPKAAAEARG